MSRRPNVVLLSADALRADHTSLHGYERRTTPFLASFASDGSVFTNAFSASSHTREAVPSLLTGERPHRFADAGYSLAADSVASRLSAAGYATAGFHSNPYVSRAYGFDEGFDTFYDDLVLGRNRVLALAQRALDKFVFNRGEYHARAGEINERSLDWIDSLGDGPFFLWNHYMDTHGPYNPPRGYGKYADRTVSNTEAQRLYQKSIDDPGAISEAERELLVDLYDGEIQYLDAQLRSFIDGLEERGLLDHTLVIVTADHGDAFGEHGYYTHPRRIEDELLHVPLVVWSSPVENGEYEFPVSTLDVVPTILEATDEPDRELPGTSLYSDVDSVREADRSVFSSAQGENDGSDLRRFAARTNRWKWTVTRRDSGDVVAETLYRITPESGPIPASEGEVDDGQAERLWDELRTHSAAVVDGTSDVPAGDEVDGVVEDRLESLGYR